MDQKDDPAARLADIQVKLSSAAPAVIAEGLRAVRTEIVLRERWLKPLEARVQKCEKMYLRARRLGVATPEMEKDRQEAHAAVDGMKRMLAGFKKLEKAAREELKPSLAGRS